MSTRGRSGEDFQTNPMGQRAFRLAPVAQAIALIVATGVMSDAYAARAFSPAWFGDKGAIQNTVATTGLLPNGKSASSLLSPLAQQQKANAQFQQSIANLNLAARGIAAQQAAQAAARQAAMNGSTAPDGLTEGGLKVDTDNLTAGWLNARDPVQTQAGGKTEVKIEQTADKAILNWETFNVGKNTTVQFQQQSDWAVLNRVNDPMARPSQIQGQIKADGTVLIVNRNGIVFSGSSQVNTRNLVAAATVFNDSQFVGNGIYSRDESTPSFANAQGTIDVQAGAQIATNEPTSVTQGGGYVLLMGKEVRNAGEITTQKGQAQLAAGDSFIIRKGVGTDTNTSSTTRGNEISPQLDADSDAGRVTNTGLLLAREGDVTVAGRDVQQSGVAVATTTVNTRGTVHLLNSASDAEGRITLGDAAITAVVIEDDGKSVALDSQRDALIKDSAAQDLLRSAVTTGAFDNLSKYTDRRDLSRIEIVSGGDVDFEGRSLTLATGGQIAVSAAHRNFVANQSQLDVSGAVGVNVAMESNNVLVNVQGNELRDSPLNRDSGNLFNSNVWIDRRQLVLVPAGTDGYESDRWYAAGGLLEVSGYLSNQGHGIGEWAAQGGTIVLGGSEVITQAGSSLNLSGGSLDVQTGYVHQTWLKGSDGRLYSLDNAPADMVFEGVYKGFEDTHARWGEATTQYFYNPLIAPQMRLENGYTVGRDAGHLIVSAPTAVLEGDLVTDVFNGVRQTRVRDALDDGYRQAQTAVASEGTLSLGRYDATNEFAGRLGVFDSDVRIGDIASVTGDMGAVDTLADDRIDTVWFDAERLDEQHLGGIDLATSKKITVEAPLALAVGGRVSLVAPVVDLAANVTARGGSLIASNVFHIDNAPNQGGIVLLLDGSSSIVVHGSATLDVRGAWVNTRLNPDDGSALAHLDGGSVTLASTQDVVLETGSVIDVSSGGAVLNGQSTLGGKGGDVALLADARGAGKGNLTLDGEIRGFGVKGAGTLTLWTSGVIVIGDQRYEIGSTLLAGNAAPADVVLTQDLFIPAGALLPAAYGQVFTSVAAGTPLPFDVAIPAAGLTLPGDWVVPVGAANIWYNLDGQDVFAPSGTTIPKAAYLYGGNIRTLPAGYVLPPAIFAGGFNLDVPVTLTHVAGTPAPVDVTIAAGTAIRAGTVLARDAQIEAVPVLHLADDVLSSGFSTYAFNGERGLIVPDGVEIAATAPVLRFNEAAVQLPTGADPSVALDRYLAPVYTEEARNGTLTQRAGADLELQSGSGAAPTPGALIGGGVIIGEGARVSVDPGHSVTIASGGQITVDGAIEAPGGDITIVNNRAFSSRDPGALSIWIGGGAVLDAAARAYTATDAGGATYGIVPDGGKIVLGSEGGRNADTNGNDSTEAFVVVRPGAMLDVSGAGADFTTGGDSRFIASNGGSIALRSFDGIYNEGDLRAAAGGAGAAGGSLTIELESPIYRYNQLATEIPSRWQAARVVTVSQDDVPYSLPADLRPGVHDDELVIGRAGVSAAQVKTGGFDDVSLWGRGAIAFDGDVDLAVGRSLSLLKGQLVDTVAGGHVALSAPYVLLDGQTTIQLQLFQLLPTLLQDYPADGALTVDANLIDVRNRVGSSFAHTRLVSQEDLRFLASSDIESNVSSPITALAARGDLDLVAARVYPASEALVKIYAGATLDPSNFSPIFDRDATISISRPEGAQLTDVVPYSVFGDITLSAAEIRQGGTLVAPLGAITLSGRLVKDSNFEQQAAGRIELLPDSRTSVSAAGLVMPYGGTVDGVTYTVNGGDPVTADLATGALPPTQQGVPPSLQGIKLDSTNIVSDAGAVLDLSGGGMLTGAAFISGRGGSVDTLLNPLTAGGKVYAILPGVTVAPPAGGYATAWTGSVPSIGEQVAIGGGVPGLPAGTYTLLPANYALLPGAYRVELGARSVNPITGTLALPNGSYVMDGVRSVAHTAIRESLTTQFTVTPGAVLRTYSQYNEQGYSAFQSATAATFGKVRPLLERDGKFLSLHFSGIETDGMPATDTALVWNGAADFEPTGEGYAGRLGISAGSIFASNLTVTGLDSALQRSETQVPIAASVIDGIGAPNLSISANDVLTLEHGAVLTAAQVMLSAQNEIRLEPGAGIDTRGSNGTVADSSTGYLFSKGGPLLVVSNGVIDLAPPLGFGSGFIQMDEGASIYTKGTIGFSADKGVSFSGTPHLGARDLSLALPSINIGESDVLAAAQAAGALPSGMNMDQGFLVQLLSGDPSAGIPAIEHLALRTSQSLNFFGSVDLSLVDPASGKPLLSELLLSTPAIYGLGSAGDAARLAVDTLVWNGIVVPHLDPNTGIISYNGAPPGAVLPNGPGRGSGSLDIDANRIIFGYPENSQPNNAVAFDRLMLGFSRVSLNARESITDNHRGSLSVYATGVDPSVAFDPATYAGTGGSLNLNTPILTGDAGAVMGYRTAGTLTVAPLAGAVGDSRTVSTLGAEIGLNAGAIDVSSAIVLPSGKLTMTAANDITLADGARLDLAGRAVPFFDVSKYSWGGDVELESVGGNIVQAGGATIDLSASNNDAGTLKLTATASGSGRVSLMGTLQGQGGAGHAGGSIDMRAQRLGADVASLGHDFAQLNDLLNAGGFTQMRSFDLKQGDLVVGDQLRAREVVLSLDGGSLTVNGRVDAGGAKPGTIRLSARDDLTLASGAVLDAHGDELQVDSYGAVIDAKNRGTIELTSSQGWLVLEPGATLDLSTPDGVARGKIELAAGRTSETGGDVRVRASGPLGIRGAASIALNGFWSYSPTDVDGSIVQDNGGTAPVGADGAVGLAQIDVRSRQFIDAALTNVDLKNRIAGLSAYGGAFHLRPGVEIDSSDTPNGNLTVKGDLDLSAYRYGIDADRDPASATYGAGEPLSLVIRAAGDLAVNGSISDGFGSKAAVSEVALISPPGTVPSSVITFTGDVTLTTDWLIPNDDFYFRAVFAAIDGTILWAPEFGYTDNFIPAGTTISFNNAGYGYANFAFEAGIALPGYRVVVSPALPAVAATQADAPMLAAGSLSASLRLASGADLQAADTRTLRGGALLAGGGNMTLGDAIQGSMGQPTVNVIRTGTGDLDMLAGGSFSQYSLYGVYTAGSQTELGGVNASEGAPNSYFTGNGGDLRIVAQRDLKSAIYLDPYLTHNSYAVSNWLLRQGDTATGDPAAWSISFGRYVNDIFYGFTGFGALGGGNATVLVGGDMGNMVAAATDQVTGATVGTGVIVAVASSGRVTSVDKTAEGEVTGGTLAQAGGGDLTVRVGGQLNPGAAASVSIGDDFNGSFTNVRGSIDVAAGAIGAIPLTYGVGELGDPRGVDPKSAVLMATGGASGGPVLVPGDGVATMRARGDLVLGGVGDPGQVQSAEQAITWFSLWQPKTAIDLFSAGGNLLPINTSVASSNEVWGTRGQMQLTMVPAQFRAIAAGGSIYYGGLNTVVELAPSASGQLELLARDSIYGAAYVPPNSVVGQNSTRIDISGADAGPDAIPNPFKPASNASAVLGNGFNAFEQDTITSNLHVADREPAHIYAVNGDLLNVAFGEATQLYDPATGIPFQLNIGAKPARIRAGRDIVNFGAGAGDGQAPGLILNNDPTDVSIISAGRDIFYANVEIAGPGSLEVSAGRNLYQGDRGSIVGVGGLASGDTRPGADIVLQAGVGANGPDYTSLAALYLASANLADSTIALADQDGKVAKTYQSELADWLTQRYGFGGTVAQAPAYFATLAPEQQRVFLRSVYFAELREGGREYNDPDSKRFGSYLRGRDMIATLFPERDADGDEIVHTGDITMFGGSGVRTLFGGDIQMLAPGGQIVIGVQGAVPPATSGVVTQGQGDIQLFSKGSVLLGLSRIMTTFGGDILAWSAEGDINAGRGSKTTLVYTPPKRVYDDTGDVTLSPDVPSTGSGIATLNPIPETPPGDVDLIAPLGTIDVGEAGIRVSGNINLAALQVVNAANIQVQGKSTGIPTVAAVNVGALTNASAAASSAALAAQDVIQHDRAAARQALPSIFTVRVLGFGAEPPAREPQSPPDARSPLQTGALRYDHASPLQFVGIGQDFDPKEMAQMSDKQRRRVQQGR